MLINIGRAGILPDGDTMDLARADVAAARDAIAKNREFIVGVKARLSRDVAGANDYEVLRRAQEVATSFGLPVMIHMGQTISPFSRLVDLLKRGDIVTHMFAPPPNSIVDDSGRILPEVLAARRRGVWFDIGNGQTGHMRWDTIGAIMKAGFWPDTFSTDWNTNSRTTGVIDLPNCMSKLLGYGMTVSEAIACATVNAARIFPLFNDRGTLNVGAPPKPITGLPSALSDLALASTLSVADSAMPPMRSETRRARGRRESSSCHHRRRPWRSRPVFTAGTTVVWTPPRSTP